MARNQPDPVLPAPAFARLLHHVDTSFQPAMIWAVLWGILALIINGTSLMNADDSWLLYAAGRAAGGEVPYVDFYETNPPLILWLYEIPARIAHALTLMPQAIWLICMGLLAALSLVLTLGEIKQHPILSQPRYGNLVFAALATIVLGCSGLLFGQREHVFVLFAAPFLVQSSVARSRMVTKRQYVIALLAGIGFAIKPHFILIWLAGEIYSAIILKNPASLLRPTNNIIAAVMMVYAAAVWLYAPSYITTMLPYLTMTYGAFASVDSVIAPLFGMMLLYLLPSALARNDHREYIGKIRCWLITSAVVVLVQYKGFLNHYYPLMFFGALLLSSQLATELTHARVRAGALGRKPFAVLFALAFISLLLPPLHLLTTRSVQQFQASYIAAFGRVITASKAEGKPVMILSFDLGSSFPAMSVLPAAYPFHFHTMWMVPALTGEGLIGAAKRAQTFAVATVAKDLITFQPPIVVVDTNKGLAGPLKSFDFVAFFHQNPDFRVAWEKYHESGHLIINGDAAGESSREYTIYSRAPENQESTR